MKNLIFAAFATLLTSSAFATDTQQPLPPKEDKIEWRIIITDGCEWTLYDDGQDCITEISICDGDGAYVSFSNCP